MPRKPRLHFEGALYDVLARGNNRQPTFLDPADCETFLKLLMRTRSKKPFVY